MSAESEFEMLVRFCTTLGADLDQARAMATQMSKRADQLAAERKVTRAEAMRYLLEVVSKGRAGEVPSSYETIHPPVAPKKSERDC